MVRMNAAARRDALWAGFDGQILAGPLALLQVAHLLLPEDHTNLVEAKVQQKMDSASSSSHTLLLIVCAIGAALGTDMDSLFAMGFGSWHWCWDLLRSRLLSQRIRLRFPG